MTEKDPIRVYFIGAGPGDPDLLTIKGKEILSEADVVLYDFLAHPGCLAYTTATCRRICVGKRKGQHGKTQTQINTLMRQHAQAGARVVRLKGGDPMVFGRITEEMETLRNAGIPYGIVPGVSTIQGASGSTGIPLTHRSHSRSFAILTGTTWKKETLSKTEVPDADVLLIFMPNTNIQALIETIVSQTRHTWETPVAVISSASTAAQKVLCSTLQNIHTDGINSTPKNPVMLFIGYNVNLYEQHKWQHVLPLHGFRLFITAETLPPTQALPMLKRMGLEICHLPLITTDTLKPSQRWTSRHVQKSDFLIFCSPKSVSRFFEVLAEKNIDIRSFSSKIAAIGKQTEQRLRNYGLHTDIVPKTHFGAKGLLAELPLDLSHKRVHIYGAKELATDIVSQLRQRHATVHHHALYCTRQRKEVPILEALGEQDIVFFSSPSQVDSFQRHYGHVHHQSHIVALGTTTYAHCQKTLLNTTTITMSPEASYEATCRYILEMIINTRGRLSHHGGNFKLAHPHPPQV
jgi:uroporphyrinogen III methyltransferase / synthase